MAVGARSTVFKAGMEEGRSQVRTLVITHLKEKLIDDKGNRPDRGSPEYEWAMDFTNGLVKYLETVELD